MSHSLLVALGRSLVEGTADAGAIVSALAGLTVEELDAVATGIREAGEAAL